MGNHCSGFNAQHLLIGFMLILINAANGEIQENVAFKAIRNQNNQEKNLRLQDLRNIRTISISCALKTT